MLQSFGCTRPTCRCHITSTSKRPPRRTRQRLPRPSTRSATGADAMATKVVMEALSPTMEEGRLVEWKKNTGDAVAVGDVLAEVETDKAVMELVARAAGVLINQAVAAGSTVPVAGVVGWIGNPGETVPGADEGAHGRAPQPSDDMGTEV